MVNPKRIAVFGATGQVGSRMIACLLAEQHLVQVLVREKSRLTIQSEKLTVIEGDVLDYQSVEKCVAGSEAVYVLLGTKDNLPTQVYSAGTGNVLQAMNQHGVKRIICLSSAGVLGYDGGFMFGRIIVPLFLRHPYRDKRKQLDILSQSDTDWTLVRPTEFNFKKDRGKLTITYDKPVKMSISLPGLIDYLYHELGNRENIHKMPIIGD